MNYIFRSISSSFPIELLVDNDATIMSIAAISDGFFGEYKKRNYEAVGIWIFNGICARVLERFFR